MEQQSFGPVDLGDLLEGTSWSEAEDEEWVLVCVLRTYVGESGVLHLK